MPNKAFPWWYFPGVMEYTPDPTGEGDMPDEEEDEEPTEEPDEDPNDVPDEPDAVKKARLKKLRDRLTEALGKRKPS
jgi:hypothetical protein